MTTQLLVDIREAASSLGISRSTLYKLLSSGTLRSVRLGGRRLIRRADLEQFIAELPTVGASR